MATQRFAPETLPPMKEEPGHFMVQQAKRALPQDMREKVPAKVEKTAAEKKLAEAQRRSPSTE